jgi:hypothetical protein
MRWKSAVFWQTGRELGVFSTRTEIKGFTAFSGFHGKSEKGKGTPFWAYFLLTALLTHKRYRVLYLERRSRIYATFNESMRVVHNTGHPTLITNNSYSDDTHSCFPLGLKHLLIFRKNIQCRIRWMINRVANTMLV